MRIVLVKPRDPNNIGAAARALANFGLGDLVVVAPHPPIWSEVRSAIGADRILARARVVATLGEALADCVLVGATTAGTRRRLEEVIGADAFASEARALGSASWARTALVFGNEKHGLTAEEIARCHRIVRIATSHDQPSLNLAQAVAICCYEASRGASFEPAAPSGRRPRRAMLAEVDGLASAVASVVALRRGDAAGARAAAAMRRLVLGAAASSADVRFLRGLFGVPEE